MYIVHPEVARKMRFLGLWDNDNFMESTEVKPEDAAITLNLPKKVWVKSENIIED